MIPDERIEKTIVLIRGQKVIIDADLAELYGVTTGNLNKAVKRNIDRFPNDFMFQLTPEEYKSLRFRFGILKKSRHSKYLPYAFTPVKYVERLLSQFHRVNFSSPQRNRLCPG